MTEQLPPALPALHARAWIGLDEVDHFVPHQANGVLLGELVERSGLSGARTHPTVRDRVRRGGSRQEARPRFPLLFLTGSALAGSRLGGEFGGPLADPWHHRRTTR